MIFPKISTSILTANLLAIHLAPSVDAHGYLLTPRSRNYRATASEDGKWYGGTATTPAVEVEPQSLNIGGTEARCGKVADRNYD
jgi:predicted carbohydrate-binding protein with CBM5 and CBM33 domain